MNRVFLALIVAALWTGSVFAHHPFSAEFDMNQTVTVSGTVTKVEWQNPHVYAYIDAKDDQGRNVNWKVELASPSELMKAGWTQTSLRNGSMVSFKGWKSKSNPAFANADSFTIDGKTMTAASSAQMPADQLARADAQQQTGTSGTQELPSTASPLALVALLGGLSVAGAFGVRALRR
jgi:hypothetical protein